MKILVLGVSGMLGHRILIELNKSHEVHGTCRKPIQFEGISDKQIHSNINVLNYESVDSLINDVKPEVIINCIGIIKQLKEAHDPILSLEINSLLPHKLLKSAKSIGARLIHFSTDCVFDGKKGNYLESDQSNAADLYGKSKNLGEIDYDPSALTLRTSIIGRELNSTSSLIDWFLSQTGEVNGFQKAIFSGFPTKTVANVLNSYILKNNSLSGLYHFSAQPIDKWTLLNLTKDLYNKDIQININDEFTIDRSLNSSRFQTDTGYNAPPWKELIKDLITDEDDKLYR